MMATHSKHQVFAFLDARARLSEMQSEREQVIEKKQSEAADGHLAFITTGFRDIDDPPLGGYADFGVKTGILQIMGSYLMALLEAKKNKCPLEFIHAWYREYGEKISAELIGWSIQHGRSFQYAWTSLSPMDRFSSLREKGYSIEVIDETMGKIPASRSRGKRGTSDG